MSTSVTVFGDSLAVEWPALIGAELVAQGGTRLVDQWSPGAPGGGLFQSLFLASPRADVSVFVVGTNDLFWDPATSGPGFTPSYAFLAHYRMLLDDAWVAGTKPMLATIPMSPRTQRDRGVCAEVANLCARQAARERLVEVVPLDEVLTLTDFGLDEVHLNSSGYAKVAEWWHRGSVTS